MSISRVLVIERVVLNAPEEYLVPCSTDTLLSIGSKPCKKRSVSALFVDRIAALPELLAIKSGKRRARASLEVRDLISLEYTPIFDTAPTPLHGQHPQLSHAH